jgi:uncharacterized protein
MDNLTKKWSSRWIIPKAKAFNSSIDKIGVKAKERINIGEVVGVLGGIIVPKSDIKEYWKTTGHIGIQIDEEFFIVPPTRKEIESLGIFNHSCEPNCGFKSSIVLVAVKNINPEEELTFDYGGNEAFFEQFKCKCGAKNCRKIIKPTDWKLPELQNKYKKYFSPYIKDKIVIS